MTQHENHPDHSGEALTRMKVQPILQSGVLVTCPVQEANGRLPDRHSGYFDNISPPLQWSGVPEARAWAIIVEDPDAPQEHPFIHWMIWNIGGEVTALPEGLPNSDSLITPQGAVQGRNGVGGHGWFGPRPPAGHGTHRYYFQVFALADPIEMGPDTPLTELLHVLKGTTLAHGEMMATYEAPESAASDFSYESEGKGGGKSRSDGTDDDPAANATVRGEEPRPGGRARGEGSRADQA
jgi:Raf kinase inhibitor-like YbhB/YbcL family protein